jgi:uncharacterized membrane protein
MEAVFRIGVQWLHVTAGVLWIGGGFYTILVQLPALLATPPAARGAIMPNLVPRQFTYAAAGRAHPKVWIHPNHYRSIDSPRHGDRQI